MDKLLRSELFVRALALAIAIVVFIVSQGGGTVTRVVTIPVSPVGLASGLVVDDVVPASVKVTVTGAAALVNGLDPGSLSAFVALQGAVAGSQLHYVSLTGPQGLRLAANPPDVTVHVENLRIINAAVQVQTNGSPAAGYAKGSLSVQPPEVAVSGPASLVGQMAQVVVQVSLSGLAQSADLPGVPVPVDGSGKPVQGLTVTPSTVQVTVPIDPVVKAVPVQVQTAGQPAAGYAFAGGSASPADVTIQGPQSVLNAVSSVTAQPVSIEGATGTVKQTVSLVVPAGVTSVNPSQVTVTATVTRSAA